MEINVKIGELGKIKADAILLGIFEGVKRLQGDLADADKMLGGEISKLIQQGETKGKLSEVTVIHSLNKLPADKVAIVGLGKTQELTPDKIRIAIAETFNNLRKKGVRSIATTTLGAGVSGITVQTSVQTITEGAILGSYSFQKYITGGSEKNDIEQLIIVSQNKTAKTAIQHRINESKIMAEAVNLARDMVNEPSNYMTPTDMAAEAKKIAKEYGLLIEVLEREQMKKLGMGALLGVAQGSKHPPKFIVLKYKGRNSGTIDIALVGKGITFDSGGISLKPSENMGDMKSDMAGGASVIAAISAIARFNPEINVMSIVAATENLPSGTALKPADIVTAMNGKTIEIENTDAEGRLTLADAICYAKKQGAKRIVDVATLTGACVTALGEITTGAFTNNQALLDKVTAASSETGDKIWQMPMFEEYKAQYKSDVADMKNTGGRKGGAITAALFISEFVENTPWVHLDIAGTAFPDKPKGYYAKGATGIPTRTLIRLVLSLAKTKRKNEN